MSVRPAGKRRQRLAVQANTPTLAGDGSAVDAWATVFSRWAQVLTIRGNEGQKGFQRRADVTHVVRFGYDPDTANITTQHRINWGGRILNIIRAYDPDGLRKEIEAEAREDVT